MATSSDRIPISFIVHLTIDAVPREPFRTAKDGRTFEQFQSQLSYIAGRVKGSLSEALTEHYEGQRDITPWLERLERKEP